MDETIAEADGLRCVDSLPCGLVRSAGLGRATTLGELDRPAMRRGGLQANSCAYTPLWLRRPVAQLTLVGPTARTLDQNDKDVVPMKPTDGIPSPEARALQGHAPTAGSDEQALPAVPTPRFKLDSYVVLAANTRLQLGQFLALRRYQTFRFDWDLAALDPSGRVCVSSFQGMPGPRKAMAATAVAGMLGVLDSITWASLKWRVDSGQYPDVFRPRRAFCSA